METFSVVVDVPSIPSFAAGQWALLGVGVIVLVALLAVCVISEMRLAYARMFLFVLPTQKPGAPQ